MQPQLILLLLGPQEAQGSSDVLCDVSLQKYIVHRVRVEH